MDQTQTCIGGVWIPGVYVQTTSRQFAGKTYRTWTLRTRIMRKAQFDALENVIQSAGGIARITRAIDGTAHVYGVSALSFRLNEWPVGVYATVYVTQFSDDRRPFSPGDGTFDRSGRTIELALEEA